MQVRGGGSFLLQITTKADFSLGAVYFCMCHGSSLPDESADKKKNKLPSPASRRHTRKKQCSGIKQDTQSICNSDLVQVVVVERTLRFAARPGHHGHGFYRVVSVCRLTRKHDAVSTVKHSVGHVGALSAGRPVLDHGWNGARGGRGCTHDRARRTHMSSDLASLQGRDGARQVFTGLRSQSITNRGTPSCVRRVART